MIAANNGKWLYILNQGDNTNTTNTQSGIAGFTINQPFQLSPIANWWPDSGHGCRAAVHSRGSFESVHLHREFQRLNGDWTFDR